MLAAWIIKDRYDDGASSPLVTAVTMYLSILESLLLHSFVVVALAQKLRGKTTREASHFQQRLNWDRFSADHARRGTFKARLRMSKVSFDKLLQMVRLDLVINEAQAAFRGGSVMPEMCLCCTLRWLAGGSHLDLCDIAGISKPSFYRVLWKTIISICNCEALDIVFPRTRQEVNEAARGFTSRSHQEAINNCATVVDGFLFRIKTPPKRLLVMSGRSFQVIVSAMVSTFRLLLIITPGLLMCLSRHQASLRIGQPSVSALCTN